MTEQDCETCKYKEGYVRVYGYKMAVCSSNHTNTPYKYILDEMCPHYRPKEDEDSGTRVV